MGHLPASSVLFVNFYPLRLFSYSSDERRVQVRGIILMISRFHAISMTFVRRYSFTTLILEFFHERINWFRRFISSLPPLSLSLSFTQCDSLCLSRFLSFAVARNGAGSVRWYRRVVIILMTACPRAQTIKNTRR